MTRSRSPISASRSVTAALDLIETSRRLAQLGRSRPRQADLKRAVSTAYYAVFHALARCAADTLVGSGADAAWTQVYRSLEHGTAKNACRGAQAHGFPPDIVSFAGSFVELQEARHRADYDPGARYARPDVLALIAACELAIGKLQSASRADRKAFAVWVLFQRKR